MLAAIALGSNLPSRFGDPAANLREAVHRCADLGTVTAVSGFHRTEPVGPTDQPWFTNAALLLATPLGPLELLRGLLAIETAMGRIRAADQPPKGPRVIDLDLLLYQGDTDDQIDSNPPNTHGESLILADPDLMLPHPSMHERRFVLAPLAEIAPNLQHPLLRQSVLQLLTSLP